MRFTRLYDYPEAATYLGTTSRHVQQLRRGGQLPAYKVGSVWRFKAVDMDAYLANQATAA